MTRDDIMALVNQSAGQYWADEAHIQRFAARLIAAEREACAKLADYYDDVIIAKAIRAREEL